MSENAQGLGKRAAGRRAASLVEDGMRVGLGTGSTTYHAIVALGERRPEIVCVATSRATEELAVRCGLDIVDPGDVDHLDVDIDGADEVDAHLNLTKGGGGAHAREKIVATLADRFYVVVDASKLVDRLGSTHRVPVEVLGFAVDVVPRFLTELGATDVGTREHSSDNGNPILDAEFGPVDDPHVLSDRLNAVPGVVEHGIFTNDLVHEVIVGDPDGEVRTLSR